MTSPIATFGLLRALGHMSPKAALAESNRHMRWVEPGLPVDSWMSTVGHSLHRESVEWGEEITCSVGVLRSELGSGVNAYCILPMRSSHPSTIAQALIAEGVPLLYEMTRRAMWGKYSEPLETFVVVAAEPSGDFAQYALGDSFEELGADQFRRALGAYRRAERDGWPGWAEAGVQVLELPGREEE